MPESPPTDSRPDPHRRRESVLGHAPSVYRRASVSQSAPPGSIAFSLVSRNPRSPTLSHRHWRGHTATKGGSGVSQAHLTHADGRRTGPRPGQTAPTDYWTARPPSGEVSINWRLPTQLGPNSDVMAVGAEVPAELSRLMELTRVLSPGLVKRRGRSRSICPR